MVLLRLILILVVVLLLDGRLLGLGSSGSSSSGLVVGLLVLVPLLVPDRPNPKQHRKRVSFRPANARGRNPERRKEEEKEKPLGREGRGE